jgi:HPt (histidine-containing phosphotransfer) domain-containing protein
VQSNALVALLRKWTVPLAEALPQPLALVTSAPLAPPVLQSPALDPTAFAELQALGGDEDPLFLRRIVEQFMQDARALIATLHRAAETGDGAALERAAHALKSTSACLGAHEMAALCQELQQLGRTGELVEAASIVAQLGGAWDRVHDALEQEYATLSAVRDVWSNDQDH